jgi:hypothetical protein
VKRALLRRRHPTIVPDWIGFLAFRESSDLRLAAILAPAVFPFGAAAGTNGEGRFCKPEPTAADITTGKKLTKAANATRC